MTHNPVRTVLQRWPLRVTLVVALVLLAAVGLAVTGAVVTSSIRGYLVGQVDKDLSQLSQREPRPGDFGGGPQDESPFATSRDEYFGVSGVDGAGLQGTTTNHASPPRLTVQQLVHGPAGPFTVSPKGKGADWRVIVKAHTFVNTQTGEPVIVVRGVSLADVEDTTNRLVVVELLVGAVVLALLGGLAYVVVRTSLQPLQEVEVAAAEIAGGDLTRRVPESHPSTEVGRLSRAFNSMVSQIETAFRARETSEATALASEERMRRFVADASHELRTPLTSIRGFAELYRQGAVPDAESLDRVMRRVEDEAARMGLLVEDLLVLARLDQQRPLDLEPVDLLEVAGDVVHDARVLAPDRTIDLALHGDGAPVVLGDEGSLRQVVTNLVSNALAHTPAGTPVSVSLEVLPATDAGQDRVLLAVADQGPGMTEEARAKVFERFYRADPSRTRAAGGSGLGLSIVAALVAAHGGRVGVQSEPGAGSRFLVELPQHHVGEHAVDESVEESEEDEAVDPGVTRSDLTQVDEDSQAGHRLSGDDAEEPSPSRTL